MKLQQRVKNLEQQIPSTGDPDELLELGHSILMTRRELERQMANMQPSLGPPRYRPGFVPDKPKDAELSPQEKTA
jgi:hypothetical protein